MKTTALYVFVGLALGNLICLFIIPETTLPRVIERSFFQAYALIVMCIAHPKTN